MQHEYRYAMYNRPVWGGLSLSQPYTIDFDLTHPDILENRKYYNRDAYSILITNHPLTADEMRNLELVDIAADNKQRAHKTKLIEYVNTLDGVSDSGKRALIPMVEIGKYIKNKADVDKYADKFMSQGTRSKPNPATPQTDEPPIKHFDEEGFRIRMHSKDWRLFEAANAANAKKQARNENIQAQEHQRKKGSKKYSHINLASCKYEGSEDYGRGMVHKYSFVEIMRPIRKEDTPKAPAPNLPPILTAPPELAADVQVSQERKGEPQGSSRGGLRKGDTERARQLQRDEQDKIIHKGTMVFAIIYGRKSIVARVNKKTYTLQSEDGLKFTADKVGVTLLEDQTIPQNLIQYAGATKKRAAAPTAKPVRNGQTPKQNVTLIETWTQGEDSFGGAETETGKTHKNLTQAQALKRIKDNPRKNYDIYVGGERVMLWSGAGRPFRVEYSPEQKSKQTPAPKHTPAPTPDMPPILTAPPELAADLLGGLTPTPAAPKPKKQPAKRKPAPNLPPILTAPPELAADVLGTEATGGMRDALKTAITEGFTAKPKRTTTSRKEAEFAKTAAAWGRGEHTPAPAAPKRKPAARTTKPKAKKTPAAKPRKTTKKTAKPKAKKTAAAPKLTASQREYLAIQGFVMVKRGGKYVRITG